MDMKKLLLLCFVLSAFFSFAQNWQPFPLGQKSYFMHNNIGSYYQLYSDTVLNEFCADSIVNYSTSQTYYFNFKTPGIGDCYSTIISGPNYLPSSFFYSIHDNERPDSITVSDNEYTLYFYDAYFNPQNSFVFKPLTVKDSSWIFSYAGNGFNQLKITCDSIYYDIILGSASDSMKLFSVQALDSGTPVSDVVNQEKYILSKNYGFKSYKNLSVMGFKTDLVQEGFNPPLFEDYFHLNIGDVLIWKDQFSAPPWPGNPPSYINYYKDSITNVYYSFDTIIYYFNRLDNALNSNSYSSLLYKNKTMSYLGDFTSTIAPDYIDNTSTTIYLDEVSPFYIKNGYVYKARINDFKYLNTNNCESTAIPDYSWDEYYNTKFGLYAHGMFNFDQTTSWEIVGSTINGIQEGVVWSTLVTGINSFEKNPAINIYPNPSPSGNFVLESEQITSVELLSIDGKTVFTQTINQSKTELRTGLPKGLYFAKITFENKKQVIQKLIVSE